MRPKCWGRTPYAERVELTPAGCREDLERFERELRRARVLYPEEHPLVQLWLRRKRTAARLLRLLEERKT